MSSLSKYIQSLNAWPDFSKMETAILVDWKKKKIFERVNKKGVGKKEKVYYDGPITANNEPHYGHTVQWILKDVMPRYWTMQGYFVSRNMGWDCQGIPVEYEVEKSLGFEKKEDIERYGIAKFNDLCRKSVFKYRDLIYQYESRIGRWIDPKDTYYTMDSSYIESIWWSLKTLYQKGLLYEGHKVVAYSTRAGTTLSTHEVNAGGYQEVEDPGVTIKFRVIGQAKTFLLAWTTTPWTLPGNLLLGVDQKTYYVDVLYKGEKLIVAKDALKRVFHNQKDYRVIGSPFLGKKLLEFSYEPLFNHFSSKRKEGAFRVVHANHVTTDEGTGIVHLAPYGAEDFEILMQLGVSLFDYLDETAHFTKLIPEYEGLFYKKANEKIIADLQSHGLLLWSETIRHKVAMCWRTDTPLIYKPVKSWYVAVTKIKDKLLRENRKILWVPEHVGSGWSGNWIENARDWALSRSRYWGTPLPLWQNDKTLEQVFVGSFAELEKLSGEKLGQKFDPHRPFVDVISWPGEKGGTFRRVKDVIDVWYDSGAMPFAKLHYPFEHPERLIKKVPAEYVAEMYEQARLWFYTMLVINVALFGNSPYKCAVNHGIFVDATGKKLSKRKRNFPPMDHVLSTYGADILRFFVLTSPVVRGEAVKFDEAALISVKKEFFTILWNSYKYFMTYAEMHQFDVKRMQKSNHVLDRWIVARFSQTQDAVYNAMNVFEMMEAARALPAFIHDLSTWYIRRSRDRLSSGDLGALSTLYRVLVDFTKLAAPFLPFVSEEMYLHLVLFDRGEAYKSVHLADYPKRKKLLGKQKELLEDMSLVREIASLGNAIRKNLGIPSRQPLLLLTYGGIEINEKSLQGLIADEVNVKRVVYNRKIKEVKLDTKIDKTLKQEGLAREIIRQIQDKRKAMGLTFGDQARLAIYAQNDYLEAFKANRAMILKQTNITQVKQEFKQPPKKFSEKGAHLPFSVVVSKAHGKST